MHFVFFKIFLENKGQKKPQTFLTNCDLVFHVKLKKLLKIFLKLLPGVIYNNVIEQTCAYFSCSSFTLSGLWVLYN